MRMWHLLQRQLQVYQGRTVITENQTQTSSTLLPPPRPLLPLSNFPSVILHILAA